MTFGNPWTGLSLALILLSSQYLIAQTPPGCTLQPSDYCTDCNTCPAGGEPAIYSNPDLMASCENLKIAFVLDESGSIQNLNAESDVENGVMVFLNALNCTGAEVAIIEFGDVANTPFTYSLVTDTFLSNVQNNYLLNDGGSGQSYDPQSGTSNSYTNWQAGFHEANMLSSVPDLVLFFTDGNPTAMFEGDEESDGTERCFTSAIGPIRNATRESNILKCSGSHVFVLGVAGASASNLEKISGLTELDANNELGNSDYVIADSFDALAMDLAGFANDLCPFVSSSVATCSGTNGGQIIVDVEDVIAANGYDYIVRNSANAVIASATGLNSDPLVITGLAADDYIIDIIITSGSAPNSCTRTVCFGETVNAGANPTCTASNNGPITCTMNSVTLDGGSPNAGVSFNWSGPNGFMETTEDAVTTDAGLYTLTVEDGSGCTSVCFTTVAIDTTTNTTQLTATTCDALQAGVASVTLTNQAGCDSIVITTTTLLPSDTTQLSATTCDPQQVGVTQQDLTNQFGCDSIVITTTTLLVSDITNLMATSCNPLDTGVTQIVLTNQAGCDSTVITTTTLNPTDTTNLMATSCDPQQVGVTQQDLTNQFGCDSIVITTTTLLVSDITNLMATSCNPLDTGVTQIVLTNQAGCDSTVITTTTLLPSANAGADSSASVCEGAVVDLNTLVSVPGGTFYSADAGPALSGSIFDTGLILPSTFHFSYVLTSSPCDNDTAIITITINIPPAATAVGGDLDCVSQSIALSGGPSGPGFSYAWTGPGGFTSAMQNPTVSVIGTYTLTVTNALGCTGTASASVADDATSGQSCPLILSCANDTTVTCASSLDYTVLGEPDFQKSSCCSLQVAWANWNDSFSGTCPRILTRTWTAYDIYGNFEQCVQTITIVDDGAAPTLSGVPNDSTVLFNSVPAPPLVTATDGCLNQQYSVSFSQMVQPGGTATDYLLERTWTAADACGNQTDSVQVLNVVSSLSVQLNTKALLEAPVSSSGVTGFASTSVFQSTDPYGLGAVASNTVVNSGGNATPIDWLLLQLRDENDPRQILAQQAVVLRQNGDVVDAGGSALITFAGVPVGRYYVVVDHYNHLGAMTESAIDLNSIQMIDFTSPSTALYTKNNSPMKSQNGLRVMWMGDTNGDNVIKYIGTNNDRDPILLRIGGSVPTNTVQGNFDEDTGLDGTVKYVGYGNDRDPILINLGGSVPTSVRKAQLPEIQ